MSTRLAAVVRPSDPLVRNAYALVLSTVISGGLGVVYWIAAAHLFSPRELGLDSAALTVIALVASVAGMNLSGALAFLLPKVGPSAGRYIGRAYRAATAFALALAVIAAAATHLIGGSRNFLSGSSWITLLFVVGAAGWVIFTVQDGVLIGLQRSTWVLTENTAFGLGKLALLGLTAWWGLAHGVLVSWIVPALALVPIVNYVVFQRALPTIRERAETIDSAGLRRFLGLNYASALVYQAYVNLLPVLVLVALGAEANGLFYVAWTWSTAIDLVSHAMGASLTVEGAANPGELPTYVRRTTQRLAELLIPAVIVMLLVAPTLMGVYGDRYRASADVLRLLVLGAIPRAVVIVAQAASRARGEAGLMLWSEAVICTLALGLTAALIHAHGAKAVGWAWLAANTVAAALVLRRLRPRVSA